jgi:hypothetical protein
MNKSRGQEVEGKILYYGLVDWWFSVFSDAEREYIDNRFQPMNQPTHSLTKRRYVTNDGERIDAAVFLNSLATWFRDKSDASILKRIHEKIVALGEEKPISGPGYVDGRHFVTFVNDVKELKKLGNLDEAERLLLKLVVAMEKACKINDEGVAPWYYHELAKIYRKKKEYQKEVTILKRFSHQKHARGVGPKKLLERLEKARVLAEKSRKKIG